MAARGRSVIEGPNPPISATLAAVREWRLGGMKTSSRAADRMPAV